ncbi:MAG: hypothetical protein WDN28_06270, partial [Chthoniobacter sp.]
MRVLSPLVVVVAMLLIGGSPTGRAQSKEAVLTGATAFKTPAALSAQQHYSESLQRARQIYIQELDPSVKAALAASSLEEANAINDLKKRLETGGLPATTGQQFKTPKANEARVHFESNVSNVQRQYAAELQPALKTAMAGGLLDEANLINSELKGLAAVTNAAAIGVPTTVPLGTATLGRSAEGLLITRYPKHPSQVEGDRRGGNVPYTDFGKPLGAPKTIHTISTWTKAKNENAVVAGFINITQPGIYGFRTTSGWDRNELLIDGKVVCKFHDGENKEETVELRAGVLPIVSVGYYLETDTVHVQWKPPGAGSFSDIPAALFSH